MRWLLPTLVLLAFGCDVLRMRDQPKLEAMEATGLVPEGTSALHPPVGTVSRGTVVAERGRRAGAPEAPRLTGMALVERGRDAYEAYCSHCHGLAGYADGMVVERGFPKPPSYHTERLRSMPPEEIVRVIAGGRGKMPPLRTVVKEADRRPIAYYVRALQRSQHASVADVPAGVEVAK